MIEDPPKLTVHPRPARPDLAWVDALLGAQTGHVVDAMNGRGALDAVIKPLPGTAPDAASVTGVALTCWAGPDDNLALLGALAEAEAGDVVVAATDGFRGAALAGDMVCGMLRNRGVTALVTDGMVRDSAGILAAKLPVFSAGVTPNSPARNGPGIVGGPVTVGGVGVRTGDIVVCDPDGVVVVPIERAEDVVARLEAIRRLEGELEAQIEAGLEIPPFYAELDAAGAVRRL